MNVIIKMSLIVFMMLSIQKNGLSQSENMERPYIEVVGTAKKEVTPDEIYIIISIKERYQGREKVTIEDQEKELLSNLEGIQFPSSNIKLKETRAGFIKVKTFKKAVIESKSYELKASTTLEVSEIFKIVNEANIESAYITRTNHSQLEDLKKELRIEAIKNAKNKAVYLLSAIGNEIDLPLLIRETSSNNVVIRKSRATTNYYVDGIKVTGSLIPDEIKAKEKIKEVIEYEKLKLEASIYIKFGIK